MKYKVIDVESDYEEVETAPVNSVWEQTILIVVRSS